MDYDPLKCSGSSCALKLQMNKVIFDYSKCIGTGDCVDACPLDLLEVSKNGKWCKARDDVVENKEAVEGFHQNVEEKEHGEPNLEIKFDVPECILCRVCEVACPEAALRIEE